MGARTIQRAMKAQIAPPKVAVEARPCAWAGRATSRGERSRAAGLAPPAERCERPVARFGLDPPGGPAADGTAGRAPGGRRGRDRRQGRKSHSESGWTDPSASFNDRDAASMLKFWKNLTGPCGAPTYLPTYLPYLWETKKEITRWVKVGYYTN